MGADETGTDETGAAEVTELGTELEMTSLQYSGSV